MRFAADSLTVRYGAERRPALVSVSFNVPSRSLYVILGPNGSGKSTLLRALLGSIPIAGGSITVEGRPLRSWTRRQLARAVGVVPQSEHLAFPISVRELVAMGRYPHLRPFQREGPRDLDAIDEALAQCDVLDLVERSTNALSGGELQRVRIARALAQEPRALVLDEPTANLDLRHEMAIFKLLRTSVDSGLTVILVTHHIGLAARFGDRLLLLHRGRVEVEGIASAVLDEAVLERVYEWPIAVRADPSTGELSVTPLSG